MYTNGMNEVINETAPLVINETAPLRFHAPMPYFPTTVHKCVNSFVSPILVLKSLKMNVISHFNILDKTISSC